MSQLAAVYTLTEQNEKVSLWGSSNGGASAQAVKKWVNFAQVIISLLSDINRHLFFLHVHEIYSLSQVSVFDSSDWSKFSVFYLHLKLSAEASCCASRKCIWRMRVLVCANGRLNIKNWRVAIRAHIKCPSCPASHFRQWSTGDLRGRAKKKKKKCKHTVWGTRKEYSLYPKILHKILMSCDLNLFSQSKCLCIFFHEEGIHHVIRRHSYKD